MPPPQEQTSEEERAFNELCSAAGVDDERREAAFKKRCRANGITVAVNGGRGQGGGQSQQDVRLEEDRPKATSFMANRLGEDWRKKAEQHFASRLK
eukprot:2908627-Prymnesium_polylepis.3